MKKKLFVSALVFWSVLAACATAGAAALNADVIDAELNAVLTDAAPQEEIRVILRFKDTADLEPIKALPPQAQAPAVIDVLVNRSNASQTAILNVLRTPAVKDSTSLWIINGMAITATPVAIKALSRNSAVGSIILDALIALPEVPATTKSVEPTASVLSGGAGSASPPEWNIAAIGADDVWDLGFDGTGVVVGTIDSGVDVFHADLSSRWRGGANSWYDPNGEHAAPYDASGHGTQTMGIILGGDATGTAIGVAPGAQWIAAKVFNDAGQASLSAIHLGYQWMLDPDGNPGTDDFPDIVNNSWGLDQNTDECIEEFRADIQALKAAGIAVVFSAGNNGPGGATSISPANNVEGFAVGSVDGGYTVALSSSRGPGACEAELYPELVAPGVNIKTATLTYGGIIPTFYSFFSGTSAAAPHVAGTMALLLDAFPSATVADLETALKTAALDLGSSGPDDDYGHGMVDALAAYAAAGGAPTCTDADGDGFFAEGGCGSAIDCDDSDAGVYPGATEIPDDGIDQDCDGIDLTLCVDDDGDGYYAAEGCGTDVDCDDTDASIHPGATEIPDDGIDQDCDGSDLTLCVDADGDGYFAAEGCGTEVDCDDSDASIHPGATEIKSDGVDQDCNGYDMTLVITRAIYRSDLDRVIALAETDLGATAGLTVNFPGIGTVNMNWNADKNRWQRAVGGAVGKGFDPNNPGVATVTGVEGVETEPITIR